MPKKTTIKQKTYPTGRLFGFFQNSHFDGDNIKKSIDTITDPTHKEIASEIFILLSEAHKCEITIRELNEQGRKFHATMRKIFDMLYEKMEKSNTIEWFEKAMFQGFQQWEFENVDYKKLFYQAIKSYFSNPDTYRFTDHFIDQFEKAHKIKVDEFIKELLTKEIITDCSNYNCPRCIGGETMEGNTPEFNQSTEWTCLNCGLIIEKEEIVKGSIYEYLEKDINYMKGKNFDQL